MLKKKTRQIMFFQLGYYDGKFDGIWGKKSKLATKRFQQEYGLKVDSIYGPNTEKKLKKVYKNFMNEEVTEDDFQNTKYFTKREISCNDNCGYDRISKQLLYNIYALRYYMNEKMNITSACRCEKHNKKVGGRKTSRHYNYEKFTKAIDFSNKKTKSLSYRKKITNFWINYIPNARYSYSNGYGKIGKKAKKVIAKNMGSSVHIDVK